MRIKELIKSKNGRVKVVGVYLNDDLLYIRSYCYDEVGFVEKMITVFRSGEVDVQ